MVNRVLEKRLNKCVAVLGLSMNVSNQRTGVNRDLSSAQSLGSIHQRCYPVACVLMRNLD